MPEDSSEDDANNWQCDV